MRYHGGGYLEGIIDFSSNLNPLGIPKILEEKILEAIEKRLYKYYPDSNYKELREAIAKFFNINVENLVVTNGSSEAISLILSLLRPDRIYLIEPTFGDYDLIAKALNLKIVRYKYDERDNSFKFELKDLKIDEEGLLIICNPNNPTGSFISSEDIIEFANKYKEMYILIDEAYIELSDYESIIYERLPKNIIVLKTFTKVFSIPGLRIGFVYSKNHEIIESIDYLRPIWNINSIADYSLTKALKESADDLWDFIYESKKVVKFERKFLYEGLKKYFKVYKSVANFLLLKSNISAEYIKSELLKKKIYVRISNHYGLSNNYIRVSVRRRFENELLIKSLEEILRNH